MKPDYPMTETDLHLNVITTQKIVDLCTMKNYHCDKVFLAIKELVAAQIVMQTITRLIHHKTTLTVDVTENSLVIKFGKNAAVNKRWAAEMADAITTYFVVRLEDTPRFLKFYDLVQQFHK